MNWLVLFAAFSVGGAVAALATRHFARTAPDWGAARRVASAAAVVPAGLALLFILGSIWAYATLPDGGEGGRDIAIFIFGIVALVLAVPALLGGLLGAIVAHRSREP